jgi:hypothetical protein
MSIRGANFKGVCIDEVNASRGGVAHIKLLPIIIALKDKARTDLVILFGSEEYENGKCI